VATIGKSIIIKGDLSGDEDLIIEGKVEGRVQLPNNEITVGSDGRISAEIEAKAIIVIGQTAGNLNASERVEVQSGATVQGDINAPRLQIQEGAVVNGSISMTKSPVSASSSATSRDPKPASPIEEQARKSA
jgi:cytoskeletal protein CcmA (bactofilin family)